MKLARRPEEIRIAKTDIQSILKQGRESLPAEACGLMIGKKADRALVCDHILPATNVDRSPVSFTIAPEELLKGYRHADEIGMELVGIYHSHPARASPSLTDLGFMRWSAPVWLIVSSLDWDYAAYRLDGEKCLKVRVTVV